MIYAISALFVTLVWLAIVFLNERYGLLSCDRFSSPWAKLFAYLWLGGFMIVLALLVTGSALTPVTAKQLADTPFWSLFLMHVILAAFLVGWWAATGFPDLRDGPSFPGLAPVLAMLVALLLQATGVLERTPDPPAMIGWMAALAWWKKALIVLSAMTVEEAFFRSFLQKRIGLIASTILFALAHFTYGNPLLLIGVTVISLVIGVTFYRTKNVIPGVIAHGVFDAIQLFVIVPIAVRMMGISG